MDAKLNGHGASAQASDEVDTDGELHPAPPQMPPSRERIEVAMTTPMWMAVGQLAAQLLPDTQNFWLGHFKQLAREKTAAQRGSGSKLYRDHETDFGNGAFLDKVSQLAANQALRTAETFLAMHAHTANQIANVEAEMQAEGQATIDARKRRSQGFEDPPSGSTDTPAVSGVTDEPAAVVDGAVPGLVLPD